MSQKGFATALFLLLTQAGCAPSREASPTALVVDVGRGAPHREDAQGPGAVERTKKPRPAMGYFAGTATLRLPDGTSASVDILMARTASDAKTTEERWFQASEPVITCAEYTRMLVRVGNELTVTEVRSGLVAKGSHDGETRWSWQGAVTSGTRFSYSAEVTPGGKIRVVNKGFDASGAPAGESTVTLSPLARQVYDDQRAAFVRRCASTAVP